MTLERILEYARVHILVSLTYMIHLEVYVVGISNRLTILGYKFGIIE
jgi:hypothetical protein